MAYLGSWAIDDFVTFTANTHTASTGAATDADSVPTYRIYEDETGTAIVTGSMALLDSTNTTGFYSERVQLTALSGFAAGQHYTIYITATVGGVAGTISHNLQVGAAVVVTTNNDKTGYTASTVSDKTGYSISGTITTLDGLNDPTAAAVADAIWDEAKSAHVTAGSFGEEVQAHALSSEITALNDITAAAVRTEMDSNSTQLAAIVADTNELQTDDVPGLIAALNDPTAAAITDAVWDEATSGHAVVGSTGEALTDAAAGGGGATAAEVWAYATRTLSDVTGFKLASDGLDSISTTAPSGVASDFREMMVQVWRRFFKKSTLTSTTLLTLADDGSTTVTTQTVSDDGTTQTQGAAS